jgi:hypothetical protein
MIKEHIIKQLHHALKQAYCAGTIGELMNYNFAYWMKSTQRQSIPFFAQFQ